MKKIFCFVLLFFMLQVVSVVNAQTECAGITVTTIAPTPQSGQYNYFGVKVTLDQTYEENITVVGTLRDDYNNTVPFSVTVPQGELTAETSQTLMQTCPACGANADVTSISPLIVAKGSITYNTQSLLGNCGYNYSEATVATFANGSFTINLSPQNQDLIDELEQMFSVQNVTIDSLVIEDDNPTSTSGDAYLAIYFSATNHKQAFGLHLKKGSENGQTIYKANNSNVSVAKAWSCKKDETCNSCKPRRNWFAGPVQGCDCGNENQSNDCIFETSGSGFPWGPVLGLLGVVIAIIW